MSLEVGCFRPGANFHPVVELPWCKINFHVAQIHSLLKWNFLKSKSRLNWWMNIVEQSTVSLKFCIFWQDIIWSLISVKWNIQADCSIESFDIQMLSKLFHNLIEDTHTALIYRSARYCSTNLRLIHQTSWSLCATSVSRRLGTLLQWEYKPLSFLRLRPTRCVSRFSESVKFHALRS